MEKVYGVLYRKFPEGEGLWYVIHVDLRSPHSLTHSLTL